MVKIISESSVAAGVRRIEAYTGARVEEMLDTIQDTLNDLEMLAAVEHSYAVANADQEVLDKAQFLTASNEELGVYQVLDRLLGQRD